MNTKELGDFGENVACEYLVNKGYKIVGRNYRISFGEIDIIAKKRLAPLNKIFEILIPPPAGLFNRVKKLLVKRDKAIHFVEVKTIMSNNGFFPEERVDAEKQRKLVRLSQIWLTKHNFSEEYPHQIDVIGITIDQYSKKANVHYFENAVKDI